MFARHFKKLLVFSPSLAHLMIIYFMLHKYTFLLRPTSKGEERRGNGRERDGKERA